MTGVARTIFLRKIPCRAPMCPGSDLSIFGTVKGLAAAFVLLLVMAAAPVRAEEVIFRCIFDWVCDPNRTCSDVAEDIRFRIDLEASTVERIGGNPLSAFQLLLGDRALTVLELPISGGTTSTTIMVDSGDAVHSANHIEGRILEPRQYVGRCTPS